MHNWCKDVKIDDDADICLYSTGMGLRVQEERPSLVLAARSWIPRPKGRPACRLYIGLSSALDQKESAPLLPDVGIASKMLILCATEAEWRSNKVLDMVPH